MSLKNTDIRKYKRVHWFVRHNWGKASMCEGKNCLKLYTSYQWANLSGEYTLNRSDWKMLCQSCHRRMDFGGDNLKPSCRNGHLFDEENTKMRTVGHKTWRVCRKCNYIRTELWKKRSLA